MEKCRATGSWSWASSDTAQPSLVVTASWKRLVLLTQNRTRGGSSDTEQKAVAVIAWATPPHTVDTMVTPEAKSAIVRRRDSAEAWVTT